MASTTGSTNVLDYTNDIANVVTAINALTVAVQAEPDYTSVLTRIATALETIDSALASANGTQSGIATDIHDVKAALLDNTVGISTKQVDLPYQGIYQRAMTRMSLEGSSIVAMMNRAVQEETQSPIFHHSV